MGAVGKVHCWADKGEYMSEKYGFLSDEHVAVYDTCGATCMLDSGHDGEHQWTPDDQIGITFSDAVEAPDAHHEATAEARGE